MVRTHRRYAEVPVGREGHFIGSKRAQGHQDAPESQSGSREKAHVATQRPILGQAKQEAEGDSSSYQQVRGHTTTRQDLSFSTLQKLACGAHFVPAFVPSDGHDAVRWALNCPI
jgi:hypothetical protein